MRLVDADKLIKDRVENDPVRIAATCAPTAYDVDKVVERLENCPDSTTFMYDKEMGILFEVEADVWARIKDGTEVEIPIKSGGIE